MLETTTTTAAAAPVGDRTPDPRPGAAPSPLTGTAAVLAAARQKGADMVIPLAGGGQVTLRATDRNRIAPDAVWLE